MSLVFEYIRCICNENILYIIYLYIILWRVVRLFFQRIFHTNYWERVNKFFELFSIRLAVRKTMVHMLAVWPGVRKALEALGALKWFLTTMQSLVFRQMMLMLECFWTFHTFIWSLSWKKKKKKRFYYNEITFFQNDKI